MRSIAKAAVQHDRHLMRVLAYQNAEVLERFKDKLDLTQKQAEQLFTDVKQFLYVCGTRSGSWSPTESIDQGWHEFMMYTRDYREFCQSMFGKFIDHAPRSYLDASKNTSGRARETYQIAHQIFGEHLSSNWTTGLLSADPCTACGNDSCTWHHPGDRQERGKPLMTT